MAIIALSIAILVNTQNTFAASTDKKKSVEKSKDDFQLTVSTVPYSTDPNSEYVRIYCAPGQKHSKKQ